MTERRAFRSGQKGARGEREVAKALELWWRGLEPATVFVRTPRSGGWANKRATGFKARGDIMFDPSTCDLFPFSVEVKWRATITPIAVDYFALGKPSKITGYWEQCERAAKDDGLRPLLVFRGNKMAWWVSYVEGGCFVLERLSQFVARDPAKFAARRGMIPP